MRKLYHIAVSGKTLSVVMPNYNHGHYIQDSLEAIARQSFKPLEVVVVDDASTDDSVEVIESVIRRYPFVRLLRNPVNRGPNPSLESGFAQTSGDYIFFTAADDQVLPGFFEKSMSLLARYPQAGLCSALARLIGKNGEPLGPYHTPIISEHGCFVPPEQILAYHQRFGDWLVVYSTIYKRAAVKKAGGYGPENGFSPDGLLNLLIPKEHGACFIPEPLVLWRRLETGYAFRLVNDIDASLAAIDLTEKRLRASRLFPSDFIDDRKTKTLCSMMYEYGRKHPQRADQIALLCRQLPSPTAVDVFFLALLRFFLSSSRIATRLYLFSRLAARDQRLIISGKLRSLLRR